jgi:hypothetical protein
MKTSCHRSTAGSGPSRYATGGRSADRYSPGTLSGNRHRARSRRPGPPGPSASATGAGALRARPRPRGERLGGDHGERREHPRGVGVAARLDRLKDRGGNLPWHLGLLQRHEHSGGQLLQLGRIVARRRIIEHGDKRRDDLLGQDL